MNARLILLSTAAIAGLLAAAGCGAATTSSSTVARGADIAAPALAPANAAGVPAAAAGSAAGSNAGGSGSPSTSAGATTDSTAGDIVLGSPGADVARSVTATYTVPVGSFLASFDAVIADGVALGGYVVGSDTAPNARGQIVSGEVTLAVPTAQMASLLNSLPSDFTASSINFSSVDDTSDIVDVNARLTSAKAHLTALQGLLASATSLDDIVTLEEQIEEVETSIDTDQGQLTTLTQAVTYATVTIELKERGAVTVAAATGPSVSSGVSKGWKNVLLIASVAVEVLVTAMPALVLLLIAWLIWFGRRRRGTRAGDVA